MKLVLSFLRGRTIYALILLLAVFVVGVEIVAARHGDAALGLKHDPVRRAARDHGRRTNAGDADGRH